MATAPSKIWAFFDGPMVGYFVGQCEEGANVAEYVRKLEVLDIIEQAREGEIDGDLRSIRARIEAL